MRILRSQPPRPLDLLTAGAGGRVAAACATIGVPGHVEVWEVMTGEVRHRPLVSAREARALALTPDGRFLLVGEPTRIAVLDLADPGAAAALGYRCNYPEFALTPDGSRLAVAEASATGSRLTFFEVGEPPSADRPWPMFEELWTSETNDPIRGVAWFKAPAVSPDGGRLAVVRRGNVANGELIEVRDTSASDRALARVAGTARDPVRRLAFSANGERLFVLASGAAVRVFDLATGAQVGALEHPGHAPVTGLAVGPTDGRIATVRTDGTVWVWDAATLAPVTTLDWKLRGLVSVALAADGSIGAAATAYGQVVVWDAD